jgi:hypothetical protein
VLASDDPRHILARRLRELREEHWPELKLTQGQLAAALGGKEPISVPLISSWESHTSPKAPPENRLRAYATFFATERSVQQQPYRQIAPSQLTADEQVRREELLQELSILRRAALNHSPSSEPVSRLASTLWHFPANQDVTIVGSKLPERLQRMMPYTDPDSPDHVEMYQYSDLDALVELHGHIRATNPTSQVNIRIAPALSRDHYSKNLVLLGGVDWNSVTADILKRVELPMGQEAREPESEVGGFEVTLEGGQSRLFQPRLQRMNDRDVLVEDVALFYRGPSPFNSKRTVTICNGMYQRGTFGAVRSLTDTMFRDRNEEFVRQRFPKQRAFGILFRVLIVNGEVVTPDWTDSEIRLHEWPSETNCP